MKKLLLALLLFATPAFGQTVQTKAQLYTAISANFPDNSVGTITPLKLRTITQNIVASYIDQPTLPAQLNALFPSCSASTQALQWVTATLTAQCLTLGTAALGNTGTSGHALPFLDGVNTWSGVNVFGDTTDSTSPTVGSLVTSGGLGVAKGANIGTLLGVGIPTSGFQANMIAGFKGAGTGTVWIGQDPGLTGYAGLWTTNGTPGAANYTFIADAAGADGVYFNHPVATIFQVAATTIMRGTSTNMNVALTTTGTSPVSAAFTVAGGAGISGELYGGGRILSISPTAGVGYGTGAGGTITQLTNKATSVSLSKVTGAITMNNAILNAGTIVSFVLTNTAVAATDMIMATHESGGTLGAYTINCRATGTGVGACDVRNNTAGNLSEAIVIRFNVIKSVNAWLEHLWQQFA